MNLVGSRLIKALVRSTSKVERSESSHAPQFTFLKAFTKAVGGFFYQLAINTAKKLMAVWGLPGRGARVALATRYIQNFAGPNCEPIEECSLRNAAPK